MPSSGPGIGLDSLLRVTTCRVDSFELQRTHEGVRVITPGERVKMACLNSRRASVDEAAGEASAVRAEVRQSQVDSFAEQFEQFEMMHGLSRAHAALTNMLAFTGTAVAVLCVAWAMHT